MALLGILPFCSPRGLGAPRLTPGRKFVSELIITTMGRRVGR